MKPPSQKQVATEITDRLADLFDASPQAIRTRAARVNSGHDLAVSVTGHRFLIEYKASASAGPLAGALKRLAAHASQQPNLGLPLIVVPHMGDVGRELCEQSGISWIDLSGNAKIVAPGLRIHVEGRPNRFTNRGRPPNLFAPKSSRVARQLLLHPEQYQTQSEIARQTRLGDGYVSKIVRRLEREQYLDVNEGRAVRPRDPHLLLDAWRDAYDFDRHRILKGHVPARAGDELLQRLAKQLSREKFTYAATGLGAAWLSTSFAAFRLVTLYVSSMPSRSWLDQMEFVPEPKGANLWLVVPDDEGVFHGAQTLNGISCVSPVQTYLDLKAQPERAADAAADLRRKRLPWSQHGK